ncbi:MAG TPA: hypothetical protein VFU81_23860, partial [Thermomicrobiales bacterium]|nr:hypothetical protein [Thermomicrobiales bacterium]
MNVGAAPNAMAGGAAPTAHGAAPTRSARGDRIARVAVWIAYLVIVGLSLRAPLLRTGDAQQYVAMADALAHLRPPSFSPADVASFKAWMASQPTASYYPDAVNAIDQGNLRAGGRQEFSHFWLYPLAAAPFVRAVESFGLHPGYGLFVANALLLAGALVALSRTTRPAVALVLLASPVLWFVNKAQVEVFTVSLLTVAVCLAMRRKYLLAALAAAFAATQNLPIAAAVPLFWAIGAWRVVIPAPVIPSAVEGSRRRLLAKDKMPRQDRYDGRRARQDDDARLSTRSAPNVDAHPSERSCAVAPAAIVALTVAICLLHPAYYLWRLGVVTPQELNRGFGLNLPCWERYLA